MTSSASSTSSPLSLPSPSLSADAPAAATAVAAAAALGLAVRVCAADRIKDGIERILHNVASLEHRALREMAREAQRLQRGHARLLEARKRRVRRRGRGRRHSQRRRCDCSKRALEAAVTRHWGRNERRGRRG